MRVACGRLRLSVVVMWASLLGAATAALALFLLVLSPTPSAFAAARLPAVVPTTASRLPVDTSLQFQRSFPAAKSASRATGLLAAAVAATLAATALVGTSRQRSKSTPRVRRYGWGDDVKFSGATVKENAQAAEGLRLISIEVPAEISAPFAKAGQFVQAKGSDDDKPSFYAISSPPGADGPLEFLIKEAQNNEWLTQTQSGDSVLLSPAMGKGFDLDCEAWSSTGVSQVGIYAAGSGIAPMRAVIESGVLDGKVGRLYFGARTKGALAYEDRFDAWRERGVEVVPVLSQGGQNWTGRRGYIQDALQEDEERGEGFVFAAKHGALLCGQKEMVQAVRKVYAGLGVPEERTLLNF